MFNWLWRILYTLNDYKMVNHWISLRYFFFLLLLFKSFRFYVFKSILVNSMNNKCSYQNVYTAKMRNEIHDLCDLVTRWQRQLYSVYILLNINYFLPYKNCSPKPRMLLSFFSILFIYFILLLLWFCTFFIVNSRLLLPSKARKWKKRDRHRQIV